MTDSRKRIARAIVVDARPLFSKVIRECLEKGGHIILAQVQNLDEAIHHIDVVRPNLVIIGSDLAEHSLVACQRIATCSAMLKVIIFTAHADEPLFQADAAYSGVAACVRPEITDGELLAVIAKVMAGVRLFSHKIPPLAFQPIELTGRERDVLRLMAKGKSDREIANALGVKFNTVRNHTQHILEKFSVHSRQEAVWRARHRGLV